MSLEEVKKDILKMHGEGYFDFVEGMWHEGIKKPEMFINIDTYFMKDTFEAAIQAAATALYSSQLLLKKNASHTFALVRPPGHHSGLKSQPHGFSFFNNVALAASRLASHKKKVAIFDWDVHHG